MHAVVRAEDLLIERIGGQPSKVIHPLAQLSEVSKLSPDLRLEDGYRLRIKFLCRHHAKVTRKE